MYVICRILESVAGALSQLETHSRLKVRRSIHRFVCLLIISPIHASVGSLGDSARAWLPLSICAFYCAKVVAKLPRELALVVVDGRTRTHPSNAHNNSLFDPLHSTMQESQVDVNKL
jgi:hypothetical protein